MILSVIIIFPSLLAQILFMKGVKIVGPSLSGLYTNLVPLFTSVLAIIVLDENFHIYHLISLVIIFLGIYIFERKKIWLIIVNYFEADIDIILYNVISFI